MKKIKHYLTWIALVLAAVYLACSFIAWELNPSKWEWIGRWALATLGIGYGLAAAVATDDDN